MAEFLADLFWSSTTEWIIRIGATMFIAWRQRRRRTAWPTVALYGLLVFTCLTVILESHWVPPTGVRIRQWVLDYGFSLEKQSDPRADFLYLVGSQDGTVLHISQRTGTEVTTIVTKIDIEQHLMERFNRLSPPDRQEFIENAAIELLRFEITYTLSDLERNGVVILSENIVITPSTSVEEFARRMHRVRGGAKLFVAYLRHNLLHESKVDIEPNR